ncbi:MAG: type II secretion system F family protein [Candidatus Latescibacterota bacterium]
MPAPPVALVGGTVFAAVLLAFLALYLHVQSRPGRLRDRLRAVRDEEFGGAGGPPAAGTPTPALAPDVGSGHGAGAQLARAGFWGPRRLLWYRCGQGLLALLFVAGALQVRRWHDLGPFASTVAVGGAAVLGCFLPSLWIDERVSRRQKAIRAAVPNVLDLLIVCVEAGLGLSAAVQRVARELRGTYPELARELAVLDQEIFLGRSRGEAFHNLARRTGVDELRALATVLSQSDRLGTGIAAVLRVQARSIRVKRRQMALELAHKMPVKLVFPLVLFIFPELLVVLLGPAGMMLHRTLAETVR